VLCGVVDPLEKLTWIGQDDQDGPQMWCGCLLRGNVGHGRALVLGFGHVRGPKAEMRTVMVVVRNL
jgi:hypothetical protein